jgi:hypothetical protein
MEREMMRQQASLPTTPRQPLRKRLLDFCSTITKTSPVFLPFTWTLSGYIAGQCHLNVLHRVKHHAGKKVNGWIIWTSPDHDEAEFHSVWQSPDGKLVDITPRVDGEESVLFLPDAATAMRRASTPGSILLPTSRTNRPGQPYMVRTMVMNGPTHHVHAWHPTALLQAATLGVDISDLFEPSGLTYGTPPVTTANMSPEAIALVESTKLASEECNE